MLNLSGNRKWHTFQDTSMIPHEKDFFPLLINVHIHGFSYGAILLQVSLPNEYNSHQTSNKQKESTERYFQ